MDPSCLSTNGIRRPCIPAELGSVSISNIDYNAESHPPDRTRTDLATVVRAGRTQRFAENSRLRKSSAFSLRPLRLCVETFNQTDTLPTARKRGMDYTRLAKLSAIHSALFSAMARMVN